MRWSRTALIALVAVAALLLGVPLHSADEKRLTVFAASGSYSVAVVDRDGKPYVGLSELVAPLAHPEIKINRDRVRVKGQIEAELQDGKSKVKVGAGQLDLGAKVVVEDDHVYIPLHTVPQFLSRVLGLACDLHESSRRLLVSSAAVHFSAELRKGETPALVLTFSAPVNPAVSTEPGRLRLSFARDPVVSTSGNFKFDDASIPAATYTESADGAELDVSGKVPLMANFSDGGRTITIAPAPAGATQAQPAPPAPAAGAPTAPGAQAPAAQAPTGPPAPMVAGSPHTRYLVVIDPAHGGDDPGAKFNDKLVEKDVTLAFAKRLRAALADRGITAHLLREGDNTISNEQRAASANNLHVTIYVAVHASVPGAGVRLYTTLLPDADMKPATFYPWQTAGAIFAKQSRVVAQAAVEELGKRKATVLLMPANLAPMNNIAGAAIGVELTAPAEEPDRILSAKYQDVVAAAVASGIANARSTLEAPAQ